MAHMRRQAFGLAVVLLLATLLVPVRAAHADPGCQDGGVYVVFARGTLAKIGEAGANSFRNTITENLKAKGINAVAWAELGNIDNSEKPGEDPNEPEKEYPASPFGPNYGPSVTIGVNELVKHLNHRYTPGPIGKGCMNETVVLGGFSQGAEVMLETLWRSGYGSLSAEARRHIGYVALYGDTHFNPGNVIDRLVGRAPWWVRGNNYGYRFVRGIPVPNGGILGARSPYAPDEFRGRLGSWCDESDGFCRGTLPEGNHGSVYQAKWIADSAPELATRTITKRNQLNPTQPPLAIPAYTVTRGPTAQYETGTSNPPQPIPPAIHSLKRTTDPDGIRQVYAATKSAITEAYWIPGGDGIHLHEIIHIAQGDIVSFDKVNLPEGKQALFAAVPDGVWECHWQAKAEVKCAKTISGLSGVTQVIVDNRWETQGYTHRLYILAGNGPHEYWWRDGDGKGIRHRLLDSIAGPVAMDKSTGPDGEDQLYVATPTWVYELWWWPGESVHHDTLLNITQGDIRSLDKGSNLPDGGQLLYTGTSTTAWQSHWGGGSGLSRGTIATSQTNALQIKKTIYNGIHQLYLATPDHVQEYYWGTQSGGGEIFRRPQNDITSFDKSNDGADQQVYTGTATGEVWETYWRGGSDPVGPTSKVLFGVVR